MVHRIANLMAKEEGRSKVSARAASLAGRADTRTDVWRFCAVPQGSIRDTSSHGHILAFEFEPWIPSAVEPACGAMKCLASQGSCHTWTNVDSWWERDWGETTCFYPCTPQLKTGTLLYTDVLWHTDVLLHTALLHTAVLLPLSGPSSRATDRPL
jgi:hypothetical protein